MGPLEDCRVLGRSYGYVDVPEGGLRVDGITYPAGPRAVGKAQLPVLAGAGCGRISQEEYEARVRPTPTDDVSPSPAAPQRRQARRARKVADVPAA